MVDCKFNPQVDAYHDGQLSQSERLTFESHLPGCPQCAAHLAQLRAMSNLFATAPVVQLSQIARHRLHQRVAHEMDRGLLKIGWTLSGIAASIMLVGSVLLMQVPGSAGASAETAPPWIGVSASLDTDTLAQNVGTPTAQWYLADASRSGEDLSEGR